MRPTVRRTPLHISLENVPMTRSFFNTFRFGLVWLSIRWPHLMLDFQLMMTVNRLELLSHNFQRHLHILVEDPHMLYNEVGNHEKI